MRHSIYLEKDRFFVRPVELYDAAFLMEIRSHPHLARFIGQTSAKVSDQEDWLRAYFERINDYYFVICEGQSAQRVGTVGIYNIDSSRQCAEWGRWVIRPGVNAGPESAELIYRVGFEILGLKKMYCRTVVDNFHVITFHDRSGARRTGIEASAVNIEGRNYDLVIHEVSLLDWEKIISSRIQRIARIATLLKECS